MTCLTRTYFLNTTVPGGSLSKVPGELEAKKSPHQHTCPLTFTPKLFLAQVSHALLKDLTLGVRHSYSLLLDHLAYAQKC